MIGNEWPASVNWLVNMFHLKVGAVENAVQVLLSMKLLVWKIQKLVLPP